MDEVEQRYQGKKASANVIKGAKMAALSRMLADPTAPTGAGDGQFRDPIASAPVGRRPRRILGAKGKTVGGPLADPDDDDDEIPVPPWKQAEDRPERPPGWRA